MMMSKAEKEAIEKDVLWNGIVRKSLSVAFRAGAIQQPNFTKLEQISMMTACRGICIDLDTEAVEIVVRVHAKEEQKT